MNKFSDNVLEILKKRYFAKDKQGNIIEDWEGLCKRVAAAVGAGAPDTKKEEWTAKFYDMVYNLDFIPNSPTLFNAGLSLGNLSGCFVLPIEDSMVGILETLSKASLVFASGGGCGYNFSTLRKKGSPVSRTFGESSGPIPFIYAYDAMTGAIKQGGRRKGANMGILNISHPDIEEFIDAKQEEGKLSNFNLSVAVTDEFMIAVRENEEFTLYDNWAGEPFKQVNAVDLFDKIVERAWRNGEPGIIFIDTINEKNPLPYLGEISATNPCSEQPLLPYESCNLGSINVTKFITEENIDWCKLAEVVAWSVRFLDCVITVNKLPFKEIEEVTLRTRKVGLGIMGWADLLLKLKVRYDSEEALRLASQLMEFIEYHALYTSVELAKELGQFPAFEAAKFPNRPATTWQGGLNWEGLDEDIVKHGLRNACLTTIAPTGSVSLIAGVSSGIEPNFQWEYSYHRVDKEFKEVHPLAKLYLDKGEKLPDYFVTALDIDPSWHVRTQATFQEWVDSGIAKTVNLPFEATREDVASVIMQAWKLGCKGVTVYRSGSRQQEVLVAKKEQKEEQKPVVEEGHPRKRPEVTVGSTIKVPVGACGHLYVTVNSDDKGPCEVFINLGKSGGCISSHVEALGRTISAALRSGVDIEELVDQLSNIRCSQTIWHEGTSIRSCADGVAYALRKALQLAPKVPITILPGNIREAESSSVVHLGENPECPECHGMLSIEGKCLSCKYCGYSKCV